MSRIRSIKPEFFRHENLFEAEREAGLPLRLAFISLWTVADREGRFKWRPRALKLDCLPYDDVDFSRVLETLAACGFIVKYEVDGEQYGWIPSWAKHQIVNQREAKSTIPAADGSNVTHVHARASTETHVHARGEGKGREQEGEGEGKDISSLRSDILAVPAEKPKRAKPKSQLSENAQPDEIQRRDANERGLDQQTFRAEWQRFRDHHRAKGSVMADWHAAWRTWLGNIGKFQPARAGPAAPQQKLTYGAMLAKIQGVDEASVMAAIFGDGRNDETSFDFNGKTIDADPVGAGADALACEAAVCDPVDQSRRWR